MTAIKNKELATIEEDAYLAIITNLRDLCSKLQIKVDREGEDLFDSLFIASISGASQAEEDYNFDWFENNLYSPELNIKIAKKLIEQTKNFPVDATVWSRIVNPQSSDDDNNDEENF
jgi:hypothetical protein